MALLFHRWDPNRVGPLWEKRWERGVWDRLIEREPESRSILKAGHGGAAWVPFGRNAPRWTAAEVERAVKAERRWAPQPPALPASLSAFASAATPTAALYKTQEPQPEDVRRRANGVVEGIDGSSCSAVRALF